MRRLVALLVLTLLSSSASPAQATTAGGDTLEEAPIAPPPPRAERPRKPPNPAFAWSPGHWSWSGKRFRWVKGRWVAPPRSGWTFELGRWSAQEGHWRYRPGAWRPTTPPATLTVHQPGPAPKEPLVVSKAPPPPLIESRPEAPASDAVWIPGAWRWNGTRHVWAPGLWSAPRAGAAWVSSQWQRRTDGRWQWLPGHWQPGP